MHPDLAKLAVLQAHDLEAKRLRDQMAALANHVAALETKARAAVGQRAIVVDLIAKEEALRRKEESEIADLRQKLERNRKKLDMTSTSPPVLWRNDGDHGSSTDSCSTGSSPRNARIHASAARSVRERWLAPTGSSK